MKKIPTLVGSAFHLLKQMTERIVQRKVDFFQKKTIRGAKMTLLLKKEVDIYSNDGVKYRIEYEVDSQKL